MAHRPRGFAEPAGRDPPLRTSLAKIVRYRCCTSGDAMHGVPPYDWTKGLPRLESDLVTVREVTTGDATALHELLCDPTVTRDIAPPPPTIEALKDSPGGRAASAFAVPVSASELCRTVSMRQSASSRCGRWGRHSSSRSGDLRSAQRSGRPACFMMPRRS